MSFSKPRFIKRSDLTNFKAKNKPVISDTFSAQVLEAFITSNPPQKRNPEAKKSPEFKVFCKKWTIDEKNLEKSGTWVYFPWNNSLIHLLPEELFYQIRTARNKNLIKADEQIKYREIKTLIAGLSVGQSAALTIATTGGSKKMNLADFDSLELTNTNRIRASVLDLGQKKSEIVARQIYELDPFANLTLFEEGVTDENLEKMLKDMDVIVDEIDNFHFKAKFRSLAKKLKIPVVMAFDTADGVVLDIERYDIDGKQKPFWGNLQDHEFSELADNQPDPRLIPRFVVKTMGIETIPRRFQESIKKVGSELAGVPQLGSTAFLAGILVSFAVRKIAAGEKLHGRFHIDLEKLLNLDKNEGNDPEFIKIFNI